MYIVGFIGPIFFIAHVSGIKGIEIYLFRLCRRPQLDPLNFQV